MEGEDGEEGRVGEEEREGEEERKMERADVYTDKEGEGKKEE